MRSYTPGEEAILNSHKTDYRQNKDTVKKAQKDLDDCNSEYLQIEQDLDKASSKDAKNDREWNDMYNQKGQQLEQLEHEYPTDDQEEDDNDELMRKERRARAKKIASFVVIALVAEAVIAGATIHLQQETMSMDVILWRLGYIFSIYIFTCILYAKYLKTRIKALKWLLISTFMMSFACLVHTVALVFFNTDVTAPVVAADFTLNTAETAAAEISEGGFFTKLMQTPGLLEFIICIALVFIGEAFDLDTKDNDVAETETNESSANNDGKANHYEVRKAIAKKRKAQIKKELKTLLKDLEDRKDRLTDIVNKTERRFNIIEENESKAREKSQRAKDKNEALINELFQELTEYDLSLKENLAYELIVDASTIIIEPITKMDIEAYYEDLLEQSNK